MKAKISKIINIIVLIILIPILIVSLILIVKSYTDKDNVPSIGGYAPLIVLSGSMETEIHTGDLIIVKQVEISSLKEGDIIAFYTDDTKQTIVTHRIVDIIEEDGNVRFITKGDNNETKDVGYVDSNLVVGIYENTRFGGLGNVAMFLQTPTGICIIISIPVLILIISQYLQGRKDRRELEELRKQKDREEKENAKNQKNEEE